MSEYDENDIFDKEVAQVNLADDTPSRKKKGTGVRKQVHSRYQDLFRPPTVQEIASYDVGGFPGDGKTSLGPGPISSKPAAVSADRRSGPHGSMPRAQTALGYVDSRSSSEFRQPQVHQDYSVSPVVRSAVNYATGNSGPTRRESRGSNFGFKIAKPVRIRADSASKRKLTATKVLSAKKVALVPPSTKHDRNSAAGHRAVTSLGFISGPSERKQTTESDGEDDRDNFGMSLSATRPQYMFMDDTMVTPRNNIQPIDPDEYEKGEIAEAKTLPDHPDSLDDYVDSPRQLIDTSMVPMREKAPEAPSMVPDRAMLAAQSSAYGKLNTITSTKSGLSDNRAATSLGIVESFNPLTGVRPLPNTVVNRRLKQPASDDIEDQGELLDENPVAYFIRMRERGITFVYLNRWRDVHGIEYNPYKLVVVPRSKVRAEHFTMSANGVTHVAGDGISEFTPMARWIRETDLFNMISRIDIFRSYRYWKPFRIWRRYIRRRKYRATKQQLEQAMFTSLPRFKECLEDVGGMSHGVLQTKLLVMKLHASYTTGEFTEVQVQQRRHVKDRMNAYADDVTKRIELMAQEVCDPRRTRVEDKAMPSRRKVSLRQLLQMEKDRAAERARLTEKVNAEIRLIGRFIRLINYIMLEHLVSLTIMDFTDVLGMLRVEKSTLFRAEVVFNERGAVDFVPNNDATSVLVKDALTNSLSVLDALPLVLHHPPFRKFLWLSGMDARTLQIEGPALIPFLTGVKRYNEISQGIETLIERSYSDAAAYGKTFDQFRIIHHFSQQWNPAVYRKQREAERETFVKERVERRMRLRKRAEQAGGGAWRSGTELLRKMAEENKARRGMDEDRALSLEDPDRFEGELAAFAVDLQRVKRWSYELERMQTVATRGVLLIDAKALKGILMPIPERAAKDMKALLSSMTSELVSRLNETLRNHMKVISREPTDLDEFCAYATFVRKMPEIAVKCEEERYHAAGAYQLLDLAKVTLSYNDQQAHSLLQATARRFGDSLSEAELRVRKMSSGYLKTLDRNVQTIKSSLQSILDRLNSSEFNCEDVESAVPQRILAEISEIRSSVAEPITRSERYAQYQEVFDLEANAADLSALVTKTLDYNESIWKLVGGWRMLVETYGTMVFYTLGEPFAQKVQRVWEDVEQVYAKAKDNKVATELLRQVSQYKSALPSLGELSNAHMQPRHWIKLLQLTGKSHEGLDLGLLTMPRLLGVGIFDHPGIISDISTTAAGEHALEVALDEVKQAWKECDLDIQQIHARRPDVLVLKNADELSFVLQDLEIKISAMISSEHISGIRDEVETAHEQLIQMSDALDEWAETQKRWRWLDVVFAMEEVLHSRFTSAAGRFRSISRKWVELVRRARKDLNITTALLVPGTLSTIKECRVGMGQILRGLSSWLDDRRAEFPRLYFLSDDNVFDLFSHLDDVEGVEPHLVSMFTAIRSFKVGSTPVSSPVPTAEANGNETNANGEDQSAPAPPQEEVPELVGVLSGDGEEVNFGDETVPLTGSVGSWLMQADTVTKNVLAELIDRTLLSTDEASLTDTARIAQWLSNIPSQVSLIVWHVIWTRRMEEALNSVSDRGVLNRTVDLYSEYARNLAEVLTACGKEVVARLQTETLLTQCLLEIEVTRALSERGLTTVDEAAAASEWLMALRMFWSPETRNLTIRFGTSVLDYGFEYVGLAPPVFVSQQTTRARLGMSQSLSSSFGSLVFGAPGSGKSVLVRDFALALGRQLIAVDCPSVTDISILGRFVAGCAASGAWLLLEDIDHLSPENMSALGQHVSAVLTSLKNHLYSYEIGWPKGRDFAVVDGFNVVATLRTDSKYPDMEEGLFVGNRSLPQNLRDILRPVAVCIPELYVVAEMALETCGFDPDRLHDYAIRLDTFFRDLSAAVSAESAALIQSSGLTLMYKVVKIAASLKMRDPDADEYIVLGQAASRIASIVVSTQDESIFNSVLAESMGEDAAGDDSHWQRRMLQAAVEQELNYRGLTVVPELVNKCLQLFEALQCSHAVAVCGPICSGKTVCIESLSNALSRICIPRQVGEFIDRDDPQQWGPLETVTLNWSAMTDEQLFGAYSDESETDNISSAWDRNNPDDLPHRIWHSGMIAKFLVDVSPIIVDDNDSSSDEQKDGGRRPSTISAQVQVMQRRIARMHWLVFDGPCEGSRIDRLGSMLDSAVGPFLCLEDGTRVPVKENARIIMETVNLSTISPASLAHMTIVNMSEDALGWEEAIQAWVQGASLPGDSTTQETLQTLIGAHLESIMSSTYDIAESDPTVYFVTPEISLARSLTCLLEEVLGRIERYVQSLTDEFVPSEKWQCYAERAFVFALTWSLGAMLGSKKSREKFNSVIKTTLSSLQCVSKEIYIGSGDTVFDVVISGDSFVHWSDFKPDVPLTSPTFDPLTSESTWMPVTVSSTRYCHIISLLAKQLPGVLLVGKSGSGKRIIARHALEYLLKQNDFTGCEYMCGPSSTTVEFVSRIEDCSGLSAERRNMLKATHDRAIVCVIDVHASVGGFDERYMGSSLRVPEVIRELVGKGGYYDFSHNFFKQIDGLGIIATADIDEFWRTRGVAATKAIQRSLRDLHILNIAPPDVVELHECLSSLMAARMNQPLHELPREELSLLDSIASATASMCGKIQSETLSMIHSDPTEGLHIPITLYHALRSLHGVLSMLPESLARRKEKAFANRHGGPETLRKMCLVWISDARREMGESVLWDSVREKVDPIISSLIGSHSAIKLSITSSDYDEIVAAAATEGVSIADKIKLWNLVGEEVQDEKKKTSHLKKNMKDITIPSVEELVSVLRTTAIGYNKSENQTSGLTNIPEHWSTSHAHCAAGLIRTFGRPGGHAVIHSPSLSASRKGLQGPHGKVNVKQPSFSMYKPETELAWFHVRALSVLAGQQTNTSVIVIDTDQHLKSSSVIHLIHDSIVQCCLEKKETAIVIKISERTSDAVSLFIEECVVNGLTSSEDIWSIKQKQTVIEMFAGHQMTALRSPDSMFKSVFKDLLAVTKRCVHFVLCPPVHDHSFISNHSRIIVYCSPITYIPSDDSELLALVTSRLPDDLVHAAATAYAKIHAISEDGEKEEEEVEPEISDIEITTARDQVASLCYSIFDYVRRELAPPSATISERLQANLLPSVFGVFVDQFCTLWKTISTESLYLQKLYHTSLDSHDQAGILLEASDDCADLPPIQLM